jgi:hypothetical protein
MFDVFSLAKRCRSCLKAQHQDAMQSCAHSIVICKHRALRSCSLSTLIGTSAQVPKFAGTISALDFLFTHARPTGCKLSQPYKAEVNKLGRGGTWSDVCLPFSMYAHTHTHTRTHTRTHIRTHTHAHRISAIRSPKQTSSAGRQQPLQQHPR